METFLLKENPMRTAVNSRADALRAELEETRAEFHRLVDGIEPAKWNQRCTSSLWTWKEIFVHLTWALQILPQEVASARRNRGMFNTPKSILDPMSYWYIRWLARKATPDSVKRAYDKALDQAVRLLAGIPVSDWQNGAVFYGEGFYHVEDLFRSPGKHLKEHTG